MFSILRALCDFIIYIALFFLIGLLFFFIFASPCINKEKNRQVSEEEAQGTIDSSTDRRGTPPVLERPENKK